MTHQLATPFSIYTFTPSAGEGKYEDNIKKIAKISTVEEFWRVFSHLQPIQKIENKSAYHIFRGDSRAMREDEDNINGGSFLIRLTKTNQSLLALWEKVVLCFIGGQLPKAIVGITISPRTKLFNLSIWHQHVETEEDIKNIIEEIVKIVDIPVNFKIEHTLHQQVGDEEKKAAQYTVTAEHTVTMRK